ncbi:MAG: PadR family transcriptional regulator [Gemmatimonadota bacterium]|jgi:DNA-binding PadR family transcriptional regulator
MPEDRVEKHLPLKPLTYSILLALREREDYGYGIAKRVARTEGGGIRLAPSNLYHVLDRLADARLIATSDRTDPEDDRRTYYRLTPLGGEVFDAETSRLRALVGAADALGAGQGGR